MTTLTEEQIANWRAVMAQILGPYAFIMPVEQIEMIRNRMQSIANKIPVESICECDRNKHGYTKHVDGRITCNKCQRVRK